MKSLLLPVFLFVALTASAAGLPKTDQRAEVVRDLNTPRIFPEVKSRADWQARAKDIRENTLVSCGLWPLPDRAPLKPRISPPSMHDGVAVHRVFIESYPGFFLAGTLYVPTGHEDPKAKPMPVVLNPHGHGKFGRLHDDEAYSNPARCLQFARMDMVAFSYDMVGYQDTGQFGEHRKFFLQPELELWNLSLMGLQTWNSIRAVDFVLTLPFVDPKRIAVTGESGGGTQTFMLGSVEDRLAVQAPVCMVSHSMQGGCQCENAPGLRVEFSNMEIAASAAPRRQLLVAATGDWTKTTMSIEGPGVETAYRLLGAQEKLHYEIHDFPHNYNRTSRETVYAWFTHWLQGTKTLPKITELPHTPLPLDIVRVFPEGKMPPGALTESQYLDARLDDAAMQLAQMTPKNRFGFDEFKRVQSVAWRHNLHLETAPRVLVEREATEEMGDLRSTRLAFGRPDKGDRVTAVLLTPKSGRKSTLVIVARAEGRGASLDAAGRPAGLAKLLVEQGHPVLLPDLFLTGESARPELSEKRKPSGKYFSTYNRTDVQERVQDLITACVVAKKELGARKVALAGIGRAGLWTLLAAPAADGVAADCAGVTGANDKELLAADLFTPGLRKMGSFAGVAALAAPNPAVLHNVSQPYGIDLLKASYEVRGGSDELRLESGAMNDAAVAEWITTQFGR